MPGLKNAVVIIDAVMGEGKSTWAIEEVNRTPDQKYLILTPYNTEVTRYKEAISADYSGSRSDVVALDEGTRESKTHRLSKAISDDKTIVATHNLFLRQEEYCINEIASKGDYSLIIDETLTMVTEEIIKESDIRLLIEGGLLTTTPTSIQGMEMMRSTKKALDHDGEYRPFLNMVRSKLVYRVNGTTVIFVVPPEKIEAFESIHILTYLFDGSETHGWLKIFGFAYNHLRLIRSGGGHSTEKHNCKYSGSRFKHLLTIFSEPKLNSIGEKGPREKKRPLTFSWYKAKKRGYKERDGGPLNTLRKHVANFFKNKMKTKSNDHLWTCPKDFKDILSNRHFNPAGIETWLAYESRATNDYADRHTLAFLVDVHQRPNITKFFQKNGFKIDTERYALSVLVQWIWRSAIRKGDHVTIYLPSKRMRDLLAAWLS